LTYPYVIRNGPLGTLDELLLIKGFDAQVVYGEDANLNNLLDPNEDDGEERFPPDDRDGQLNAGLRNVATVVSYQPGATGNDETKININDDSADLSASGLPDETIEFIKLYRAEGNQFKHPSELLEMQYRLRNDPEDPGPRGLKAGDWIESSVGADELPTVMEKLSTSPPSNTPIWGLVNVNSASETVLSVLPGIDSVSARDIVDIRSSVDTETKGNLAWLYTQGAVDAETFKTVAPLLTTRGYQFHIRCVGFGSPTGRFRIVEAVVDLARGAPRIVYLRDITSLGLPFALRPEELEL
jgi:DNA uptake protein ComE-like DNA-binding protein